MKVKTSELDGDALAYAIELAGDADAEMLGEIAYFAKLVRDNGVPPMRYSDWLQGGPIIEREDINLGRARNGKFFVAWYGCASDFGMVPFASGPTKLIAAMRCRVASKLGDEVDIPEELA